MNHSYITEKLSQNKKVFKYLLSGIPAEEYNWKPRPEKWCLLEIVCHLFDEEQFDFKARVRHTIENHPGDPPPIDPEGWVKSKRYIEQNYEDVQKKFLNERTNSVDWLKSLDSPKWENTYQHPQFGPMSAEFFLSNWLAHDYLHFKQITALKYMFLSKQENTNLIYAGEWN